MKVAVAVARWLRDKGIKHVFCVSGGASLHIIHGISDTEGIEIVCPQNEQAAGFAADAYGRLHGCGVALATSGPGATNLLTPLAASYYDSVRVLYLAGQVTTGRLTKDSGVRQTGFQETPICDMVRRVTKYAAEPLIPQAVIPELEMAWSIMKSKRPGPVLISIPDDIQRAEIDETTKVATQEQRPATGIPAEVP